MLGHQRNRDQTSTLKIFEVLPYFIVLLHFEQHRYFGAMDGFNMGFDNGAGGQIPYCMAFQRKASMFKFVLPKCPVLPHC